MKTVALTGAMGCGKSAAADAFRELGMTVLDADILAHEALDNIPSVKKAVTDLLGTDIYSENGKADRNKIARIVFAPNSENKLNALERILHPAIREIWKSRALNEKKVLFVEVPLLFEKRLEKDFDLCVSVYCTEGLRLRRLAKRGMTTDQISARDALQIPSLKKVELSDVILFNEGDRLFLKKQAELFLSRL